VTLRDETDWAELVCGVEPLDTATDFALLIRLIASALGGKNHIIASYGDGFPASEIVAHLAAHLTT